VMRAWHRDGVPLWAGVQTPGVTAFNGSTSRVDGHYVLSYGHSHSTAWNRTVRPVAVAVSLSTVPRHTYGASSLMVCLCLSALAEWSRSVQSTSNGVFASRRMFPALRVLLLCQLSGLDLGSVAEGVLEQELGRLRRVREEGARLPADRFRELRARLANYRALVNKSDRRGYEYCSHRNCGFLLDAFSFDGWCLNCIQTEVDKAAKLVARGQASPS
jgi:hypothetical protein